MSLESINITTQIPFTSDQLQIFINKISEMKKTILVPYRDYEIQKIRGKTKLIYYRTGWEKIAFVFNISTTITHKERIFIKGKEEEEEDIITWIFTVKAFVLNFDGSIRKEDEAVGACSSNEGKKFNHLEHDVMATAHTRAKGRAICGLVGGGLSFEEIANIPQIQKQKQEKPKVILSE